MILLRSHIVQNDGTQKSWKEVAMKEQCFDHGKFGNHNINFFISLQTSLWIVDFDMFRIVLLVFQRAVQPQVLHSHPVIIGDLWVQSLLLQT